MTPEVKVKASVKDEAAKIALAMRTARVAAGWSQAELATNIGVSLVTITRMESLGVSMSATSVIKAMALFRQSCIEVDMYQPDAITITINKKAIDKAAAGFADAINRRDKNKIARANKKEKSA
jgi:DNA-binding XRE family transcriptional regulator